MVCLYFLYFYMIVFLEKLDIENKRFLKFVLLDFYVFFYVVGLKVLGLILKMVIMFLWNFFENSDILIEDMIQYYFYLFLYLVDVCENIVDFMKGIFLFLIGVVFYDDKIFEFLIKELIYDIDVEIIFRVLLLLI